MIKYFNLYWEGQVNVLLNASDVQSILQTSATSTVIGYSSRAAADKITLTHASDASEKAVQSFLVNELKSLMSNPYTNSAPEINLPFAITSVPTIG
jgi:hypothetical protein|tara:strand:+ start:1298 stop:1585 length:288 start_codon:yes stop_codon:yes gene_type:complete